MNRPFHILIALIVTASAETALANEVFNLQRSGGLNTAYVNSGWDPVPTVGAGYGRSFAIEAIGRTLTLTAGVELPVFLMDLRHYRMDVASRIAFFDSRWNIVNRLAVGLKGTKNPVYSGTALGFEEGILGGYFAPEWFVAGELTYEKLVATRIAHSKWYRKHVYSDARDGWYSSTGGKLIFGVQGGYTFAERIEVTLRLAAHQTEGLNNPVPYGMPPFLANLGVNYHF